jgi:hypothetical protein
VFDPGWPHIQVKTNGILLLGVQWLQDPGTATMLVKTTNHGQYSFTNTGPGGVRTEYSAFEIIYFTNNTDGVWLVWNNTVPLHGAKMIGVFIPTS